MTGGAGAGMTIPLPVMPVETGIQCCTVWIPAYAGMTKKGWRGNVPACAGMFPPTRE
jgi:hypothetical protein